MNEFQFAHPAALVLLLLPPLVAWVPALRRRLPGPATLLYSDVRLVAGLVAGWRARLHRAPDVLRLLIWLILVLALARPQAGRSQEVIRGQGVDVVLALDISNSMAATDFAPQNRLEAARTVITDFIAGRQFDRIGLVVFARHAYHLAPPTLDYTVLLQLLAETRLVGDIVSPEGIPLLVDGTAIGLAIASSANMLRSSHAASKVIVLLTDGSNNAGIDPLEAASAAAALNIRIYTIGMIGSGVLTMPDGEGGTVTLEIDVNEDILESIAAVSSGLYFRAADFAGLQAIYDQIDSLERSDVERLTVVRWRDRAAWLIMAALLLMIIEYVVRSVVLQVIP